MPTSNSNTKGPIVVVVEDEFFIRANIAAYLRDAGCTVVECDNVEQALAAVDASSPDVLFTDIQLNGGGSGWELAERLRARHGKIGVVYASGNAVAESRCVPGSLFFSKPYRDDEILAACRQLKSTKAVAEF